MRLLNSFRFRGRFLYLSIHATKAPTLLVALICSSFIIAAEDSETEKPNKMKMLDIGHPSVVMIDPNINAFSYDSINTSNITVKYAKDIVPLKKSHTNKLHKKLLSWQEKDLNLAGISSTSGGDACTLELNIHISDLKYDENRLKDSEKFRQKKYGSTLITNELRDATSQKPLAIWVRRIPLTTERKDRGSSDRKIMKSLERSVIETLKESTRAIMPKIQPLIAKSPAKEDCNKGITAAIQKNSLAKK